MYRIDQFLKWVPIYGGPTLDKESEKEVTEDVENVGRGELVISKIEDSKLESLFGKDLIGIPPITVSQIDQNSLSDWAIERVHKQISQKKEKVRELGIKIDKIYMDIHRFPPKEARTKSEGILYGQLLFRKQEIEYMRDVEIRSIEESSELISLYMQAKHKQ
jgi:hypothetical protein